MAKPALRRPDIIEPDLSYKIVGVLFEVYNTLGPGYSELYYQRAVAAGLEDIGLKYRREFSLPLAFRGRRIGRQRCDFIVEDKIIIELKKGNVFSRNNIEQVLNYLRASGLKLAILANIAPKGIIFKRIVNTNSYVRKNS